MTEGSAGALLADTAGAAAAVSVIGVVQEFQFHEVVGTIAGCMAIAYYVFQFCKWIWNNWG